jgi:PTH2 family peptidyl-tRNA hydrolase
MRLKVTGSRPVSRSYAVLAQLVEAPGPGPGGSRFESAVRHVDEIAERRPTKQVIVIRRDLKMRRGKEIAQGAHASMAWLAERVVQQLSHPRIVPQVELSAAERLWLEGSFRKVTVKVSSQDELLAVYEQALEAGLVVHLITDGGLTEFGGVPTRTCLGIGPDYDDLIDPVTGSLELY